MKILIYGAGVIGSIYASRLYEAHFDITLLAHGDNYEQLKKNGIVLRDGVTGRQTNHRVPLTRQLDPDDFYDLIIVTVRLDQFETIVPVLKANRVCPSVMLLFNNPGNIDLMINELKPKRSILGFPGAGGARRDHLIDYIQLRQQPTTIGEINGEVSPLILQAKRIFQKAGFSVTVSTNMQAWLKTHAVFVSCIAAAIMQENGDSEQLGRKRDSVKKMVVAIREGLTVCKSFGMPIAPRNIKIIFLVMPLWFSVYYWQHAMKGKMGTLSMAPHANAAKKEMKLLAEWVISMLHASTMPTPGLDALLSSFIKSN